MKLKSLKKPKAESLLEAIIAFTILGIGITFAGSVMGASLRNIDNAKSRLIAVNIAREGIEAMRNIRDTNWLKFAGSRRACWNFMPPKDKNGACDSSFLIKPGHYIIYKQKDTYRWRLQLIKAGSHADLFPSYHKDGDTFLYDIDGITYIWNGKEWSDIRTLYFADIDDNSDTNGDGDKSNDEDIYNHASVNDKDALGGPVKKTNFRREIIIEYLNNAGNIKTAIEDDLNRMRVTSRVVWFKGGKEFKTELKTHLTDYLGREQLDG